MIGSHLLRIRDEREDLALPLGYATFDAFVAGRARSMLPAAWEFDVVQAAQFAADAMALAEHKHRGRGGRPRQASATTSTTQKDHA